MAPRLRVLRTRWWIFGFSLAFPLMSYVLRLAVQDLAPTIMPALHLDERQIGWLATAFTVTYTVAQLPGGIFCQKFGARWTLVAVGVLGLVATLAFPVAPLILGGTALFTALLLAQALLGVSQGPMFPAASAIMGYWVPVRQWAMANGMQPAAMNIGGAVTPVLVALLTASFGWQGALLCVGAAVVPLTIAWGWYGRDLPGEHPAMTPDELAEFADNPSHVVPPPTVRRMLKLLSDRNVLLLTLAYLCSTYAYYLLSFWSYLYLVQVRHFGGIEGGLAGALPWVGAGVGAAAGGFAADGFARRIGLRWGYRLVPLLALPVASVLLLVTVRAPTPLAAVAVLTAAFFMVEITEGSFGATIMQVAPADIAAGMGALNTGGNLGGIITQPVVAFLAYRGEWGLAFLSGTVFALAAAGIWLAIDPTRRAEVD